MQINNNVNNTNAQLIQHNNNANANATPAATSGNQNSNSIIPQDVVEISGQAPTQAQQNQQRTFNADLGRMREIWIEHDRHVESFRRLIETLLNRQSENAQNAGSAWDLNDPNAMVEIDDETRSAAQAAIGEGGPFSVEAVATRLLDFAVAISGGDPSRIDVLRRAVEQGFEGAARQWGGELPEISQRTFETVMAGFDEWAANGNAADITLLSRS
ncbi:MAG: hypothetical protein FWC91_06235 [Defluviitaleaceae bacterium]|nr:hypothetical protein [Defluviitaleaceae bacterium]